MPRTPATPSLGKVSLFEVVRVGKESDAYIKRWADSYKRDSAIALSELLSFLAQAGGCDVKITREEVYSGDIDATVKRVVNDTICGKTTPEEPFATKKKEFKNFKQHFLDFWDKLVREAQDNETLVNEDPFEQIISFIEKFSQASVRSCRYVASLCALQLVTTFIRVANQLREARDTTQRQLQAEENKSRKNKADNNRLHSLRRSLEMLHGRVNSLEALMKQVFNGVFVHRYRDIDEHVRGECIAAVGRWCHTYPSYFLKDTYLKYIGWSLNDKESSVRSAALTALQVLYDEEDNYAPMDTFTARFSERVCQMVDDIDNNVAIKSLGTLTKLVRHDLIDFEAVKHTYNLLLDDSPQLRQAAAELVNVLLTIQSEAMQGSHGTQAHENGLVQLLLLLQEFPDNPNYINYMVDALYEKSAVLKDWRCIVQLLLSDEDIMPDTYQLNSIRVLKACIIKTSGEKLVQGLGPSGSGHKKEMTKQQREAVATFKQEITVHLMKSLPLLIRKHQADPVKAAELIQLITYLNLEVYALKRQEKAFAALLKQVKDAFFRFSADNTLRACCTTLFHCAGEEAHESAHAAAAGVVAEVQKECIARLKKSAGTALKLARAGQATTDDEEYELTACLKRCYFLQHLGADLSTTRLQGTVTPLLEAVAGGWECSGATVAVSLKLLFEGLLWVVKHLNVEAPDEGAVQDIVLQRNTFVDTLTNLYASHQDEEVKAEIYNIMADLFVIFSEEKVRGTKLELVGFSPPQKAMQTFWGHCERKLAMAPPSGAGEEEEEEGGESELLITLCHVARLVSFNLVPEHPWLSAELVSHFTMHGKKVAEVIKKTLNKLKKVAPEMLWEVYLGAMKKAFDRHLDQSGSGANQSLQSFRELAHKISQVYSGFLISDRPNAAKIVRGGLDYAMAGVPRRLPFLMTGLVHFTPKISSSDVNAIVKWFDTINVTINSNAELETWAPFFNYADHLREKLHLPPLKRPAPPRQSQPSPAQPSSAQRQPPQRSPPAPSQHAQTTRLQQAALQQQALEQERQRVAAQQQQQQQARLQELQRQQLQQQQQQQQQIAQAEAQIRAQALARQASQQQQQQQIAQAANIPSLVFEMNAELGFAAMQHMRSQQQQVPQQQIPSLVVNMGQRLTRSQVQQQQQLFASVRSRPQCSTHSFGCIFLWDLLG